MEESKTRQAGHWTISFIKNYDNLGLASTEHTSLQDSKEAKIDYWYEPNRLRVAAGGHPPCWKLGKLVVRICGLVVYERWQVVLFLSHWIARHTRLIKIIQAQRRGAKVTALQFSAFGCQFLLWRT